MTNDEPAGSVWGVVRALVMTLGVMAVALFLSSVLAFQVGITAWSEAEHPDQPLPYGVSTAVLTLLWVTGGELLLAALPMAVLIGSTADRPARLGLRRGSWPVAAWVPLVFADSGIALVTSYVVALLIPSYTDPDWFSGHLVDRYGAVSALLIMFIPFIVLPGLCEELLFRGYLQTRLGGLWPTWLAIAGAALLFAISHQDPVHIASVLPAGVYLGIVRWRTGSIWPGVLAHMWTNLMAFASLILLHVSARPDPGETMTAWTNAYNLVASLGVLCLGISAVLLIAPRRLIIPRMSPQGPLQPESSAGEGANDSPAEDVPTTSHPAPADGSGMPNDESDRRFVVLLHRPPPGPGRADHLDLMLERGGTLWTWAVPVDAWPLAADGTGPAGGPATGAAPVAVERLADHRVVYLDYEGPISGDRGEVVRLLAGRYEARTMTSAEVAVALRPTGPPGEEPSGPGSAGAVRPGLACPETLTLTRQADGWRMTWTMTSAGAAGPA